MRHKWLHIVWVSVLLLIVSCSRTNSEMEDKAIVFQLKVTPVSASEVSICITHSGSNRDMYYGFITKDEITDKRAYVMNYIDSVGADEILDDVWNQRKRVEKIRGLIPYTAYQFIVFAIDENAQLIGEPVCADVQTESDIEFEVNANWQIEWVGEVSYEKSYWTQVDCHVEDESEAMPFYSCLISEEQFKQCGGIEESIYWLLSQANSTLEEGESFYEHNMVSRVSTSSYYYRLPGYYYAFAIGVNADGTPIGKYAMSGKEYIAEYTMLSNYGALIGWWKMEDAEGRVDSIKIEKEYVNLTLSIVNWAGRKWPVTIDFDATTNPHFSIHRQLVARDISITSGEEQFVSNVYLFGWYTNEDGDRVRSIGVDKLAKIFYEDDTHYTIKCAYYYTGLEDALYGFRYYVFKTSLSAVWLNNSTFTLPINLTKLP